MHMTGKDRPGREDVRRALDRPPVVLEAARGFAAVAAVLDPNLDLLLIRRAVHERDPWSGNMAFPGGRVEPEDEGPLAAALRETVEEVGLPLRRDSLLGQLDDLMAVGGRPGLVVRPFVFTLDDVRPPLTPNEEVAGVHWWPLPMLLSNEGRTTMLWTRADATMTLPCVDFEGQRLWGLTLHMVDDLLHRLDGRGRGLGRLTAGGRPG
jgi:8-oxo-dGTP pyrophosphatase MutT (NUDIX family)